MTAVAAAELVGLGVAIGAFGTLIGAGGGFLLVPLLLLLYHFSHPTAVGTSLALVFLNAASGTVAYLRQRRVDLSLGGTFAAATIPGAVAGAFVSRLLSTSTFSLTFGVILLGIAVVLAWGRTMAPSRRADLRRVVDVGGRDRPCPLSHRRVELAGPRGDGDLTLRPQHLVVSLALVGLRMILHAVHLA